MPVKKQYFGSCVNNPFPTHAELEHIIDNGKEITSATFKRHCNTDYIDIFGMTFAHVLSEFPNDLTFYKSGTVFYFEHSRIEHFFE